MLFPCLVPATSHYNFCGLDGLERQLLSVRSLADVDEFGFDDALPRPTDFSSILLALFQDLETPTAPSPLQNISKP